MGTSLSLEALATRKRRERHPLVVALRRLLDRKAAVAGLAILVVAGVVAILAPLLAPHNPYLIDSRNMLSLPTPSHWLGTDQAGRDVLSRIMFGARVSLTVGFISVGVAAITGIPLGLIAGYFGGMLDHAIMRVMDALVAFPNMILALGIVAALGPGISKVMIAIGITAMPVYARLVRSQTLALRQFDHVTAARAVGAGHARIVARHILPLAIAPLIVQASLGLAYAILSEAGLSFLGVGIRPPTATWGLMLQDAYPMIYRAAWLSVPPGAAIFLVVLGLNFLGDGLRDALDPRLSRSSKG